MILMPPFSTRARDWRVSELIRGSKDGTINRHDLRVAQFGQFPVKGMHNYVPSGKSVRVKDILSDKKTGFFSKLRRAFFNAAYTRQDEDEPNIYINRFLISPAGQILGFLATRQAYTRIRQGVETAGILSYPVEALAWIAAGLVVGTTYRHTIFSSLSRFLAPSVADILEEEDVHNTGIEDERGSIAGNAFKYASEDWLRGQRWQKRLTVALSQWLDSVLSFSNTGYFTLDSELQGRLSNMVVKTYLDCGKIPETLEEFYAMLYYRGAVVPGFVKDFFQDPANSEIGKEFQSKYGRLHGYFHAPTAELNVGLTSYCSKDMLERAYRYFLPYCYAHLLTKHYEDPTGYERFGVEGFDMLGMPIVALPPAFQGPEAAL